MLRLKVDMLIFRTSNNSWSKRLTDRKLKTLRFVVESHRVAGIRIQRNPVREAKQAQRRQPLHRDARRSLQVSITEVVIDGRNVVDPQEFDFVAGLEHVAQVVEPTHPGGALPFLGRRENQLGASAHPKI